VIAVSDQGGGIPPQAIDHVFEPFFTTKGLGKGTGLGLSQVYGFVKQSGGHVKLYSESGMGTTVKLYLPRLLTDEAAAEPEVAAHAPRSVGAETILVVEDDADVRAHSTGILRELGYTVLEAPIASVGLQLLERHPEIRLLFTDVGLPGGMNGRQLADAARQLRPDLKVLFTTGYARNAIVHHGRLDPGVELIVKPFSQASLAQKVRLVLTA
jgi:CheY-like chemotaxis protein